MPTPTLLQRLKERKLVQWALAYLAGAFVVFQLLDALAEPLGLATTVQRAILVIVAIGFFIILVLAWYHGEKGRQWVSGPELLIIALLLLISGGVLSMIGDGGEAPASPEHPLVVSMDDTTPSVAVLPCVNMSSDPADGYLALALHDEILLKLQKISTLFSIGRTSVLQYADDPPPTNEIASTLGVGFIGECSVQKYGPQIRLIFQLLDGSTGGQVWAENYDRELTADNLFDIQGEIAQQVASSMRAVLTPEEEARVGATPTENLRAYDHYLIGRSALNERRESGFGRAIEQFSQAILEDSTFAQAHLGLADTYSLMAAYDAREPRDVLEEARSEVLKAVELDRDLPEAYATLGLIEFQDWEWEEAEIHFRHALTLLPGFAPAHHWFSLFLIAVGRTEEAEAEIRRAHQLDPQSTVITLEVGFPTFFAGRYQEARRQFENAAEMDPEFISAHSWLGLSLAEEGSFDEAISECQIAVRLSGRAPRWLADLGYVYASAQRTQEAVEILRELEDLARHQYVSAAFFAAIHGELGETEEALRWLERAYEERSYWLTRLGIDPRFKSLQGKARFQQLLQDMGL